MAITIEMLDGTRATLENRIWTCEEPEYESMLNAVTQSLEPMGYTPNPDAAIAQSIAVQFAAEVVEADAEPQRLLATVAA